VDDIVSAGISKDHDLFFQGRLKLGIHIKNLGKCDGFLGTEWGGSRQQQEMRRQNIVSDSHST
jgi:hypothetical protein